MTIEEARAIIAKTQSPYLKRDMLKFIKREKRRQAENAKTVKGN